MRVADPHPRSFYAADPLEVARNLLGSLLVHRHPERGLLAGRIVETEAYRDEEDLACHASKGRTRRTDVMYGPPGYAYVYLIYGMYDMFNVVTWPQGRPSAVLVRGIEPVAGITRTTNGPGRLTRALAIDRTLNKVDLTAERLFVAPDVTFDDSRVEASERIGIDYAGEWARKPWRFSVVGNPHVSRRPRKKI